MDKRFGIPLFVLFVLAVGVAAQTYVELDVTTKALVLVHTPEVFAADLADTVTERLATMLDERLKGPSRADWQAWHMRLMRWHKVHDSMGNPGDPDVLTLRMVAEMWRTR